MLDLYRKIKERRKELGMTQDELAKKMGYTDRSSIAKIESGKVDLSLPKIEQFANALGVEASWLMGWDIFEPINETDKTFIHICRTVADKMEPATDDTDDEIDELFKIQDSEEFEAISQFRELDEDDKKMVLNFLETILMKDKYKKPNVEGGEVI